MNLNKVEPKQYFVKGDAIFPNSRLPVLHYENILQVPKLLPGIAIRKLFQQNDWKNTWKQGIYTYHHYHSVTHEVLGVCKGETLLMLGGEEGISLLIREGDVLVIPAGVAHMNLGKENDATCVGAYPEGRDYDMKYGKEGERPAADENIGATPLPHTDPVYGKDGPLLKLWK